MDKFPAWATPSLTTGETQVSHGLNLALVLEDPEKMPLLLWDIVVAGPKIKRAMDELSFIHFARFVPSWDGSALMVTTEFDGPLEPYVMDFVIALGDVFDTLLSYVNVHVQPLPKLPIREHPDDFWKFVQKWNRVPFGPRKIDSEAILFPPSFDYPVYSAYPQKTVIDITGPRPKLLPPAIDHPATFIDLDDVQGNILNGYRAGLALHLFLRITEPIEARKWLASKFANGGNPWNGIMSAARWKVQGGMLIKPALMANVGFTFAGLQTLLPGRAADLDRFPEAFRAGAEARSEANGDVGQSNPGNWRFGQDAQSIHVVLSLYASAHDHSKPGSSGAIHVFDNAAKVLILGATSNGMDLVYEHAAQARANAEVYFDYRDGIAKPRISGQCEPADPDLQPAASPGEFLLGRNYKSIFGGCSLGDLPQDLAQNGTFSAMRLLEQDVQTFENTIGTESRRLALHPDLLKAKLLGRWQGGEPLSLCPVSPTGGPRNDFDYAPSWTYPNVDQDHHGDRCPVGAHIRRTNPRTARVAGQRHSRRLIRRGMPTEWPEGEAKKVGLLGLFMGASLERQFEFIQRQWIQGDVAASGIRGSQDPIAGLRSTSTNFNMSVGGQVKVVTIPPLVTTRGSLYLFFPSISMLRGLDGLAAPSTWRALKQELDRSERDVPVPASSDDQYHARLAALWALPGSIREFLEDLLFNRVLDSKWLEQLVAHFLPPPRGACAPAVPSPPCDIRPLDPAFIANPYPAYEALRAKGTNVVWVAEHHAYWVLTRTEAERLLKDAITYTQQPSGRDLRGLLTMDDPRHGPVRVAIQAAFTSATSNLAQYIDAAILNALGRIQMLKQFDFVNEFGIAVPRTVYWQVFGLKTDQEVATCDALAQTMMRHFGQPDRPGMNDGIVFADASIRLTGQLGLIFAEEWLAGFGGGHSPRQDTLIGEIARRTYLGFPLGGRILTFFESLMTLVQLALVHMSSQFLLGTATRNLLMPDPRAGRSRPWDDLAAMLASNPGGFDVALDGALDEARRVDAPVTIVERFAAMDVTIDNVDIKKDCPVFAVVASANRDLKPSDSPEDFHWDRPSGPGNLSLGYGIHHCAGERLQQQIVHSALRRLFDSKLGLRLCDPQAVPAWFDNIYFRALQSLPVTRCP